MNTGNNNTGNWNTGNWNTGNWNTGNYNTGAYNTGNWNTEYCNTGNYNTGDYNTGYYNTGNWNTGNCNTGNYNTGYYNTGNRNTGYCNTGDRNTGMFCSIEPTLIIFNKPSNKKWDEIDHPHFNEFYLTKWVKYADLTATEKKENPSCETTQGLLKQFTYKEAWATFWQETDEKNRQKFLALPNFDAALFEEITGINVNENSKKTELLKKAAELIAKAQELQEQAKQL